jgi:hypothetical protein
MIARVNGNVRMISVRLNFDSLFQNGEERPWHKKAGVSKQTPAFVLIGQCLSWLRKR